MKMTDEYREQEIRRLRNRLQDAIEQTAQGVTDAEIWQVIRRVCHDMDINIEEVKEDGK